MAEELKKQLEIIKEQQRKIDEVKNVIVKEFIKENKEIESVLSYSNEIDNLENLVEEAREGYYDSIRKPIITLFLRLAEVTKFTINEYGTVWGNIPSGLKEELKTVSHINSIMRSVKIEDGLYIGVYDDDCTKFAITGRRALQFVLDNFILDSSGYKVHLEKQVQDMMESRDRSLKTYDDRINSVVEKLLLFDKYKDGG